MRIDILTIFPEMFEPMLGTSIPKRAAEAGKVSYHVEDIRIHTQNKHGKVDDRPFGGGPGMVMNCQPVADAVEHVEKMDERKARRILMTPTGVPLQQALVEELASEERILLIAGHYEGIDQRVIDKLEPLELSIGDYVLSGGELPAMVLIDSIIRLIPGVLGDEESAHLDSFSMTETDGRILEHPHYTRPRVWEDREVPPVLLSGDHEKIAQWRLEQSLARTKDRRPDLLEGRSD